MQDNTEGAEAREAYAALLAEAAAGGGCHAAVGGQLRRSVPQGVFPPPPLFVLMFDLFSSNESITVSALLGIALYDE